MSIRKDNRKPPQIKKLPNESMFMNIFSRAKGENRIFKDESVLLPDFLPDGLPGREREIRELVFCLSPASENKQPEHALLYGPPGTGKTSVSRFVLKQLSEYSSRPLTIYINCWESPSRFAVLSFLSAAIGEPMPRRGIAADEIMARFVEIAKKEERIPIVVLDEADRLETSKDGVQVLYDLCRAGEVHKLKTGVIAITNDPEFHIRLDARVRSSFVQHALEFKPYSMPQLKEILSSRAKLAFAEGALDPGVVPLCAAIAHKRGGDARVAFAILHSAGKQAERANAQRVDVSHVRAVEESAVAHSTAKVERKLPDLDEIDQKIVEAIKAAGKGGIDSGKLYESLSKISGERAIRKRVDDLEKLGLIETEAVQMKMGRSRVIRIKGS
jgi:cell division control protein 6